MTYVLIGMFVLTLFASLLALCKTARDAYRALRRMTNGPIQPMHEPTRLQRFAAWMLGKEKTR